MTTRTTAEATAENEPVYDQWVSGLAVTTRKGNLEALLGKHGKVMPTTAVIASKTPGARRCGFITHTEHEPGGTLRKSEGRTEAATVAATVAATTTAPTATSRKTPKTASTAKRATLPAKQTTVTKAKDDAVECDEDKHRQRTFSHGGGMCGNRAPAHPITARAAQ
ncbi:hypothetical protein MTO96_037980 [Rhipicephalus appendiculatus]